ncbi:MAG TPA: TetR/AcrR family transcriptional regulator [Gemmatimonadaceae bacterium]|nr:TetR/AcrR family transcriptional regulator [Gemmatimonadaceae bacterium]
MAALIQEPRWRRLPEERPKQIIEAALEVFGERGLSGARLEDIAKRAGLSKGTIYLYFPNKEELFREVVRLTVIAQIERAEHDLATAGGMTATQTLEQFVRGYWSFLRMPRFTALFRLIHAELGNFPDLARFYAREVIDRTFRLLGGILERGMANGEFRRMDPIVGARMLGPMLLVHSLWCSHRDVFQATAHKSDDQIVDEVLNFYLQAIRMQPAGVSAPAPEPSK